MKIHNRNFYFSSPSAAEIVIFDETHSDLVMQVLDKDSSVFIFKTRPEEIWLGLGVLRNFFKGFNILRLKEIFGFSKKNFKSRLRIIFCIYLEGCLRTINPKGVITYIDNCQKFGWLARNCNKFPFISIQNGFRLSYDADSPSSYYAQHLFCFGNREKEVFPKLGYKVENIYPVGSLSSSINFQKDLDIKELKYDILIVSCWRGNIGFSKDVEDSMRAMKLMDQQLFNYLKQVNIKAAVILRSERDSDQWFMPEIGMNEEDYYLSIYGDSIEIIDTDLTERNVYSLMQSSDVIVSGFSTTCLLEAYTIGKKVLYCNFCETDKYHIDFDKEIVFKGNKNSFKEFKSRLDDLRDTSNDNYLKDHESLMGYYMPNPLLSPVKDEIKKKISLIIYSDIKDLRSVDRLGKGKINDAQ